MNLNNKSLELAIERISFATIQRYLANRNWMKKFSKREHLAIFFTEHPRPTEILLPLTREFGDYKDLIYAALVNISKVENREITQVINDLLLPPSDVIRFRVDNKRTEYGLISFAEGFSLLENARKSLFTTACDLASPAFFHKRLASKPAQQFIDSCYLGQTERGSFIASVICPFINETVDDSPSQLSLFHSHSELINSFTRKVTRRYMQSLLKLKTVIESGNHELIEDPDQPGIISANFIESIIELGEYGENEELEIQASWSFATQEAKDVPGIITLTKDYIAPMESMVARLKPRDEGKAGQFIGKISRAQADPDSGSRNEGEIMFNFIGDEDKIIKAKVFLNVEDFSKALEALDKGADVRIKGVLKSSGKSNIIQDPHFEILG